jgi:predicted permease
MGHLSSLVSSLGRDLRLAFRQMRRTPIVSAVALLSLALGIGANVAIFSLVNALILKALPVQGPARLVVLGKDSSRGAQSCCFSNPQWEYLRDHQDIFPGVAAISGGARFNLNAGGEARPVTGLWVSGGLFGMLGVAPIAGRLITTDDDRRGGGPDGPVAVLSYAFWQREYGGDPSVIGHALSLDGHPFTVIGVTPPEFFGVTVGRTFDVAAPLANEAVIYGVESRLDARTSQSLTLLARLAPGQTPVDAEARLRVWLPRLREATMPQDFQASAKARYMSERVVLLPAATGVSGLRLRYQQPLYVLLGIVGLVLAIACANMANLLLAQSVSRRKELAVRLALGASRGQLVRQLLVESVMLSLAGAAAGLFVAGWGSRVLVAMLSTPGNVVSLDLSMDWRVFGFTAGIGMLTGLLFGVAPAFRGTALSPGDALRDHSRGVVSGGARLHVGHGLVALQVALSFVLVFGSTLFVRTLVGLTSQRMGFESSRVLVANVDLRRTGAGATAAARLPLFERIRDAVSEVPGIESASASFTTPVADNTWSRTVIVPGYEGSEQDRNALLNAVTPEFFRTLGTPLLAGRDIGRADRPGAPAVALVNETFARKFFFGKNPVGRTFSLPALTADYPEVHLEIIGMVADAKYRALREPAQPTMYVALAQQGRVGSVASVALKTTGPPLASRDAVVQAIASVNKDIVITLKTFDEDLKANVVQERLVASLSSFFGGLALLLAALGLYGVMSYSVSRRKSEIGIRMALGAEPRRVIRLVFGHVALITVAGLLTGALVSIGTGRFVNALLYNVAATDLTTIAATAVTLAAAAAVAGYLPARRAARIDPTVALRDD